MEDKLDKRNTKSNNPLVLSIVNMAIYIGLMSQIGFIIMTTVYLTIQIFILSGYRKNKIPVF